MNLTFNVNATVNVNVNLPQLAEISAQLNRLEEGQKSIMAKVEDANILLAQINEVTNTQATGLAQIAANETEIANDVKALIDAQNGNVPDSVITSLQGIVSKAQANASAISAQSDFSKALATSIENPIPVPVPTPVPPGPTPEP